MRGDGSGDRPPAPRGWPAGFGRGQDRGDLLRLTTLAGIRPLQLHELAWTTGSAAGCVRAIRAGRAGTPGDRECLSGLDADELERAVAALDARLGVAGDPDYPERLLDLEDPPVAVFVRGRSLADQPPMVAVVGSRSCSTLGRDVALDLGRTLAGVGFCVVSGAARGIDESAHQGALTARGRTVAVLGAGIDRPYPRTGTALLRRILDQGGTLVAEYPPGVAPHARHFPARNRLIAALAIAVVVVEGAEKSGSRITAGHALDLGRDVVAVPGPITSPLSVTPHELIRDGAAVFLGTEDLLRQLGVAERLAERPPPDLSDQERRVWDALAEANLPDGVARRAGLSIPEAVGVLTQLELRDLVQGAGGRYERRYQPTPPPAEVGSTAQEASAGGRAGVPAEGERTG